MIHACNGMHCPYEGWDGECHGRGYGKPGAACEEEPDYGYDSEEYDPDEERQDA